MLFLGKKRMTWINLKGVSIMKKILILSLSLLVTTQAFGATHEVDRPHKGFSLVKGMAAAAVYALGAFTPETEAAVIRKPNALQVAPDGFPMFVQHEDYIFDPAKINYLFFVEGTGNCEVRMLMDNSLALYFDFDNRTQAQQFVDDALFGNIVTINSPSSKK